MLLQVEKTESMTPTRPNSLSVDGPKPEGLRPPVIGDYDGLRYPPHIHRLDKVVPNHAKVGALTIEVEDGPDGRVAGFLHLPPDLVSILPADHHRTAAILVSGAGGGVTGPSGIYLSLGCKLATLGTGVPTLRLDYRYPARNRYCVNDVLAAMSYLEHAHGLTSFVLVGWSFGAAPVFTVGGCDPRVVGCAAIASQTAETEGIRNLSPTPVLLLHGKEDQTLHYSCSEILYEQYGEEGSRQLSLFDGDNHALTANAGRAEAMLCDFVNACANIPVDEDGRIDVLERNLVEEWEREDLMRRGGDLRGPESIQ